MTAMPDEHIVTVRPPVWAIFLAVILAGCFYLYGKTIEAEPETPGTISVTGDGRAFAAPDIAELSLGVQTGRLPTAKAAMEKLGQSMTAVTEALEKAGIAKDDISTEYFNLNPAYDWTDGRQVARGFEANQSVRVKVRDLDSASDVLAAATEAGANQVGGISFTLDDPDAKQAEARAEAITEAKEKAERLADDLGVELGDLVGFSEGGFGGPPILMRADAMGMGGGGDSAAPLPSGQQEITVQVTLTYEVE